MQIHWNYVQILKLPFYKMTSYASVTHPNCITADPGVDVEGKICSILVNPRACWAPSTMLCHPSSSWDLTIKQKFLKGSNKNKHFVSILSIHILSPMLFIMWHLLRQQDYQPCRVRKYCRSVSINVLFNFSISYTWSIYP